MMASPSGTGAGPLNRGSALYKNTKNKNTKRKATEMKDEVILSINDFCQAYSLVARNVAAVVGIALPVLMLGGIWGMVPHGVVVVAMACGAVVLTLVMVFVVAGLVSALMIEHRGGEEAVAQRVHERYLAQF